MKNFILLRSLNTNLRKCIYSTERTTKVSLEFAKSQSTTVDPKDVQHHGKMSEEWWDTKGPLRALHSLNPLRIQFVRDGLANTGAITGENVSLPLDKIKILDVGCGGGILSEPLARIGAEVTGIDASKEMIETATKHAALDSSLTGRLQYINTSIEDHSESNVEKYDAVVASEIVEHVTDQELFLKKCTVVTKPGGSVFVTTFNKTMTSWLGGIIAAEYILKIIPFGTHDWNKFIPPNETRRLIESYGCQTKLIHGFLYNPVNNQWLWISSTAMSYALHAVKK